LPFKRSVDYYKKRFHKKQYEAYLAYKAGKTLVLPWGRRSGKSNLFGEIMVEDIEENGYDCLYVAKSQKQARKIIWKKLSTILRNQSGWDLKESRLEAVYKKGPSISVKGADLSSDNLVGSGYRVIACDEFALWRKPQIVKEILVPMLADYSGQILYGSTKRGKNHFYQLHKNAEANLDKYYTDEATIFDNPFISADGRAIVLSEYASDTDPLYRQEILNQYVAFEGMAFALPEETYLDKRWDPADLDHSFHWRGMDHGFSPDPTACVWIAYNKRFKYFQIYSEYKEQKLLISEHAENVQRQEPYAFIDTISDIDPQVCAEYEAVGLPLTPAKKFGKNARILQLVTAMKNGKLKIASNCTKLLEEIQSYEWDQDGHDHLIDATIYAYTNLVLPDMTVKPIDNRPKHIYKPSNNENFTQSFGNYDDDI